MPGSTGRDVDRALQQIAKESHQPFREIINRTPKRGLPLAAAINWVELEHTLLLKLDIAAEYQALHVELAKDATPDSHGWIKVHCVGIVDRTPSAAICVVDGPYLGIYKDFRQPGLTAGLIKFRGRVKGWTRGETFKYFAKQTGEKLPGVPEDRKLDNLVVDTSEPSPASLQRYAERKAGYSERAMREVGIHRGSYSKKVSAELRNHLFLVPMFGTSALLELEPTGYHCFPDQYGRKIRQYRGKGNEPVLLPVMSVGPFGLMGADGLKRLAEAQVVNLVEGVSDLIAMQAVLGPWRDGATEADSRRHVVLTTGGCSNYIKDEWAHHFADKEVRLWPDVGDSNNAGVNGMAVQLGRLLPVAKAVRTVMLPLGKDGGKNDVRAWLTKEGTDRGYADVDAYALTFQPHAKNDKTAITGSQKLLKDLGLTVLGQYEGSRSVEVYSEPKKKRETIPDLNRFSIPELTLLVGEEPVQEFIHDGKEVQPGMSRISDVRNAIANEASDEYFNPEQQHGAGPWLIEEQIVLVKTREIGLVKGDKIETSSIPFYEGWILDTSQATGDWVNFDVLSRYLAEAQRDEWCQGVFTEAESHFAKWPWNQAPAPKIVASLVICSWLQTMWDWRPEVFLTGGSDTGKSMLIGEVLSRLFGNLALYVHKPTEAAIRQHVQHHGKIILIDEFEHDQHRQKVLELFRTSSRGGLTIRGTSDQKGVSFQLRHIPWFAAIETGLKKQPDKNRFVILDLNEIPADKRGKITLPTADQLRDLGLRLLAVGLRHFHRAKAFALDLRGYQIDGVPGRCVETYGVPCGMYSAIFGHRLDEAQTNMRTWLAPWDFATQSERDHVMLLQAIYTSEVNLGHGKRSTVSALLALQTMRIDPDESEALARLKIKDATEALANVGIKRVVKKNGDVVIYFHPPVVSRLLRGTEFENQLIGQFLRRLDGAKDGVQQRLGSISPRGIEVPESTVEKLLGHKDGDNDLDGADSSTHPDRQSGEDGADGGFWVVPRKVDSAAGLAETASSQADADRQTT